MATPKNGGPPPEGASPVGTVDPALAAKAQAEVEAARSAPREEQPKKRGRPPGSTNKAKAATTTTLATTAEGETAPEPATPEQFAALVDMANMAFRANMIQPIGEDEKKEWAAQAALVANRWGGQLPLMPELTLIATTGVIFGPRVVTMLSKEHKARVAAEKKREAEREHNARVEREAKRDERPAAA